MMLTGTIFTDPPVTTLVTAESDKGTCDAEVCADKLEPSGADDVGMIVVQEAASVDDHNRAQGIGECNFLPIV
jgi:hypothetical protein